MYLRVSLCALLLLSSLSVVAAETLERAPDRLYVRELVDGAMICRVATAGEAASMKSGFEPLRVFYPAPGQRRLNAGLTITLRSTAQLDGFPSAKAAFVRAAQVWEGLITNPVNVTIDVDFGPTRFGIPYPSPNILGSTGGSAYYVNYPAVRSLLLARADSAAETSLYNKLPVGTVPTDLGAAARLVGPLIQLITLGFDAPADPAPSVGFNSAFAFDLEPSNGIDANKFDFEAVTVHEIGHALGFVSSVGDVELDPVLEVAPSIWDLFRFRPGVTSGTFQAAQRPMSSGGSHIHFAGAGSLAMSTGRGDNTGGDEQQSSHWKDDTNGNPFIGLMDPTIPNGTRLQLSQEDLKAFDVMGYSMNTGTPVTPAPAAPSNLTATGTSSTVIRLTWVDNSSNETEFRIEQKVGSAFTDLGSAAANATAINVTNFAAGQSGTFRVRARNGAGDSAYSNEATGTTTGGNSGGCAPNATTVCLANNRFRVSINFVNPFSNPPNQPGTFLAARLDSTSGINPDVALFGFSSAQAVEVVVRVQDARPFAPRFDIYYGGMTDVGYTVTVTDTVSGVSRQYVNSVGTVGGGLDRSSFPASALGNDDRLITSGGKDSFYDDSLIAVSGPASHAARKVSASVSASLVGPAARGTSNIASLAAGGGGACSEVEPNETSSNATTLTLGTPCTGNASIADQSGGINISFSGGGSDSIEDVYKVTLTSAGKLDVTMSFTNGLADLDVYLFTVSGNTVTVIGKSNDSSTTEQFQTTTTLSPGTYFIGVSAFTAGSPYTLNALCVGCAPAATGPTAPSNLTATATSSSVIRLNWNDNSNNETEFRIEQKVGNSFSDLGAASANATTINITGFSAGQTGTFRVRARNATGDSAYTNEASATTNGGTSSGPCVVNATTVCLLSNRFRVSINFVNPFSNPPNQPGTFLADKLLPGTQNPDTGLFGFSNARAVEVVVRVQDARPFAPRFDIYYGGMTDVGYTVTVTDTQTGTSRAYTNTVGKVGGGVDRGSFPAN